MNFKNQLKPNSVESFTLIELMVVIAILALLAAGIVPSITTKIERENVKETKQEIKRLKQAIKEFYRDIDKFPDESKTHPLRDLEEQPTGMSNWDGPYITSKYEQYDYEGDAWENQYSYSAPSEEWENDLCVIYSYGPDEEDDSGDDDDIKNTISPQPLIEEKRKRVKEELEVIKKSAQLYYNNNSVDFDDIDIEDLYCSDYYCLADESYRTDEWGRDYVNDGDKFISQGPDPGNSDDDISPY